MTQEKETPGHANNVPGAITTQPQNSTTPSVVQQAKALTAQGFRVLPVGPDKLPLVDGFGAEHPDFTCGPEWFGEPGTSVAILCGPCPAAPPGMQLLCIDVDSDDQEHDAMWAWVDGLPDSLTSHGGRHLYFWVPAGTRMGPAFKRPGVAHDGLDLKGPGGYAREARWDWSDPPTPAAILPLPAAALATLDGARGGAGAAPGGAAAGAGPVAIVDRGADYLRQHGFDPDVVRQDAIRWLQSELAPLPTDGTGGGTLMVIFGALMVGFGLEDDVALELVCDVYAPRAWPGEEPDEEGFAHKIDEIDRLGSSTFEPLQLAVTARNARRFAELQGKRDETRAANVAAAGGIEHPSEDHSGCALSPRTGWPWILQKDRRFWLHKIDAPEYHPAVSASELTAAVYRHLPNQVLFSSRKDLESTYIRPVGKLMANYLTKANTYNPTTDTLSLALLDWMDPARATFHAHIDSWLRALAGPRYPELAQWLVSCTALDRPAPLLYMAGEGNLGKTLLMNGLAALWGVDKPGKLREVISDFNECLEDCPLVFADEGLPSNISFDWLRESITEYSQRLNTKGIRKFSTKGCARYAVAANNFASFRYLKVGNLTKQDLRAIASRILAFECQPEAEAMWMVFDTHRAVASDIPEHILWLVQSGTAPVEPTKSRMAARAVGGELLMSSVLVGRYSEILRVLQANLEGGEESQGRDPIAHLPKKSPGELWVSVPRLFDRMKQVDGAKVSLADVRAFCQTHQLLPDAVNHEVNGKQSRWRVLDARSVQASIEDID